MAYMNGKKVFDAKLVSGYNEGFNEGQKNGRQEEQNRFWTEYLNNISTRKSSNSAFSGTGWTDSVYNPNGTIYCGWSANQMYDNSKITNTKVPIDISSCSGNTANMFRNSSIHTIPQLIVSQTASVSLNKTFTDATQLSSITISGVIMSNCNMEWCPLDLQSMLNVIEHLKNYVGTDEEGAYKLTFNDDCWNLLNAYDKPPSGQTWQDYVQYSLGWSV